MEDRELTQYGKSQYVLQFYADVFYEQSLMLLSHLRQEPALMNVQQTLANVCRA